MTPGTIVWGQVTGVEETYSESFLNNWIGTNGTISGAGDLEVVVLDCPTAQFESETHYLGVMNAIIDLNVYRSGSGELPLLQYKTGSTRVACDADTWHLYDGISFTSLGWIKIRVIKVN